MDQQIKTKPEENQNKPVELSDKDLEHVAGGVTFEPTKIEIPNIKTAREESSGLKP